MNSIRFGVIGCGGIAQKRTIPGLLLAKNAVCTALMDRNEDFLHQVGDKFGIARRYTTVDELLAQPDIDAVYIATPVFCHKEQVFQAADAGLHILLEKPMGLTAAEGEEMNAYCAKRGVKFGIGFMMRFHGAHEAIRRLLAAGEIGEIVSAYAKFNCTYPVSDSKWRQTKAFSGGGAMIDMGIHCIDLLQYMTGLNAVTATGFTGNQIFQYPDTEDAAGAVLRMNNGALFTVEANFNIPDEIGGCRFEIYGTAGCIVAERTLGQTETGEVTCTTLTGGRRAVEYDTKNMYTKEIEGFADAIVNNTAEPVPAAEAIFDQKIVEAVYESQATGKHIPL